MKTYHIFCFIVLISIVVLNGCASPAKMENMTVSSKEWGKYDGNTKLKNKIVVDKVSGGQNTNPMWTSEISNENFAEALTKSLADAQLLSRTPEEEFYSLSAVLIEVKQPAFGASMTVTTSISYSLVDNQNKKEVLYKKIVAPYTAKWDAAFFGVERLRLANEGSARSNIQMIIDELYLLDVN